MPGSKGKNLMLTEQIQNVFQKAFQKLMPLFSHDPQDLELRRHFLEHFDKVGFPSNRLDDWKYTDFSSYPFHVLQPSAAIERKDCPEEIKPLLLTQEASQQWLFVNGHAIKNSLSQLATMRNLASIVPFPTLAVNNSFQALNSALYQEGAHFILPSNTVIQEPIIIVHATFTHSESLMVHPRNFIVAEENSEATIIELYLNKGQEISFTNAVSHLVLKKGANIKHLILQRGAFENLLVSHITIQQAESSNYSGSLISAKGGIKRTTINVELNGENAECQFYTLATLKENQKTDIALSLEHNKPSCKSHVISRSVVKDKARNTFTGKIIVEENASKTQANLESKNLLLSTEAEVNTRPQLEIYNDDVQCSHGATVGALDTEALFYLRSRGLDEKEAIQLLINAFVHPALQALPGSTLKYVENLIHES